MLNIDTLRIVMRGPLLAIPAVPPIAYENRTFTPPNPSAHTALFLEEGVEVITENRLASGLILAVGETRYEVFAPRNSGTETVDLLTKKIADAYESGVSISGSGIAIECFNTRRLPGGPGDPASGADGAWYSVPVIVSWRAFTPTINS